MGRILIRGEAGHDIIPELYPAAGEVVIDKPGKGAFYNTELGDLLNQKGIKDLLVTGVTTEVCVNTTVREANDRGYRCIVLGDCCASYFPEFHEMGLRMIKAQGGIFGWVSSSEKLLTALAFDGEAPRYSIGGDDEYDDYNDFHAKALDSRATGTPSSVSAPTFSSTC